MLELLRVACPLPRALDRACLGLVSWGLSANRAPGQAKGRLTAVVLSSVGKQQPGRTAEKVGARLGFSSLGQHQWVGVEGEMLGLLNPAERCRFCVAPGY